MLTLDGSRGEGGGQILRTALALSAVTGRPFRIERIRAGRRRPGLLRQHLAAALGAAEVAGAELEGANLGSLSLTFRPGPVRAGDYALSVGTAGSATLVLQTVLPALIRAGGRSTVRVEGGTHNPCAPPFEFLQRSFVPLLRRMGAVVRVELERPGFYPAGGGSIRATVEPGAWAPGFELRHRGELLERGVRAVVARLPVSIARRELDTARRLLDWPPDCLRTEVVEGSRGPGNVVLIEMRSREVTEIVTGFGSRGVRAETVAAGAARAARAYLAAGAPVGPWLADQLMLPLALAGGGVYRTTRPTAHTFTNAEVIRSFLDVDLTVRESEEGYWEVGLRAG